MKLPHTLIFLICSLVSGTVNAQTSIESQIKASKEAANKQLYEKALKIALQAEDQITNENSLLAVKVRKQIGSIYQMSKNNDKALPIYFELLKTCSDNNYNKQKVDVLNYIGYTYYGMNLYEKALKYYKRALALANKINYESGVSMCINNVAAVLETKGQYGKAKNYFLQAIKRNKKLGKDQWLGINHMNIGVIENEQGYSTALSWFEIADSIFTEINQTELKSSVLLKIALFHTNHKNETLAFKYVRLADSIAKENDYLDIYQESNELLTKLYLNQSDSLSALVHQLIYSEAFKKNQELNNVENALFLEQKFLLDKYETERELEKSQQFQNQIMIIISSVLGFGLLLVFISRLRIKLKHTKFEKKVIKDDLDDKSRQLAIKTIEHAKRKQFFLQHVQDIKRAISTTDVGEKDFTLSRLKSSLEKESDSNVIREFEVYFQKIHAQFYNNLNQQFPELSRNERRLCAFLYLDMSSKEISTITGQRIKTIEVARTRLRKKMNLNQTGINLSSFLIKMGK